MLLSMDLGDDRKYGICWRYRYVPSDQKMCYETWCFAKVLDYSDGTKSYMGAAVVKEKYGKDEARLDALYQALCVLLEDTDIEDRKEPVRKVLQDYSKQTRVPGTRHRKGPFQESLDKLLDAWG